MSERVLEITRFLAALLGIILGAIVPPLVSRFLPAGVITLGKWGIYTVIGVGGTLGAILVYWMYTGNINYWGESQASSAQHLSAGYTCNILPIYSKDSVLHVLRTIIKNVLKGKKRWKRTHRESAKRRI